MMHEDDWQSFLRMMDIFLRVNQGVQTGQIVLAVAFYLVLMLLSLLTFFAMAYFAITLSHTLFRDKKWRTFADMIPQMLPYALYDLAIVLLSLFGCGWMLDKKVSL